MQTLYGTLLFKRSFFSWNQPSEEVQDRAKAVTSQNNELNDCRGEESFPVTSTSSFQIYYVFPTESHWRSANWPRDTRNKGPKQHVELTRENETKATACLNQQKQVTN